MMLLLTLLYLLLASDAKIYHEGDVVPVSVRGLTFGGNSRDEKLYLYPVDYYNATIQNCGPVLQGSDSKYPHVVKEDPIFGNHYQSAPINTVFMEEQNCESMCDRRYNESSVTLLNNLIKRNYQLNFYIGDIPVGKELYDSQTSKFYIDPGVPLGYLDMDKIPHLFKHFQFVVYYTSHGLDYEILYATLSTQSLTRITQIRLTCELTPPLILRYSDYAYNGNRFSYSFVWKEIQLSHPNQLKTLEIYKNDAVRPLIANSILSIFFLLTIIIAYYTYYTTNQALTSDKIHMIYKNRQSNASRKDMISSPYEYNVFDASDFSLDDESLELSWPSLLNDVFRTAAFSPLLYHLIGQGAHFAVFGFLVILQLATGGLQIEETNNQFAYGVVSIFTLTAVIPGFINAFLFKTLENWKNETSHSQRVRMALSLSLNTFSLPIIAYILCRNLNRVHDSVNSPIQISSAFFWATTRNYSIITTSAYLISYYFLKVDTHHVSEVPKKIAPLPITFQTIPNMLITGVFPFGIILVPLSTLYLSLWYNRFFSCNGLFLSSLLLIAILISVSVLNVYHSLSVGNWKWQWYSFLSGSSIGVYAFGYSFYLTNSQFGDHASFAIFLLQNITISGILALAGGSIAYIASFFFVRKLYWGLS